MTKREELIEFINNDFEIETNELRMGERVISAPAEALVNAEDIGTSIFKNTNKEELINIITNLFDDDLINIDQGITIQVLSWYQYPRKV